MLQAGKEWLRASTEVVNGISTNIYKVWDSVVEVTFVFEDIDRYL